MSKRSAKWLASQKVIPLVETKVIEGNITDVAPDTSNWPVGRWAEIVWPLTLDSGGFFSSNYNWNYFRWSNNSALSGHNSGLVHGTDAQNNFEGTSIYCKVIYVTFKVAVGMLGNLQQFSSPIIMRLWKDEEPIDSTGTSWVGTSYQQPLFGDYPSPTGIYVDPNNPHSLRKINPDDSTESKRANNLGWTLVKEWVIAPKSTILYSEYALNYSFGPTDLFFKLRIHPGRVMFDRSSTDNLDAATAQISGRYFLSFNWIRGTEANNGNVPIIYHAGIRAYYTDA